LFQGKLQSRFGGRERPLVVFFQFAYLSLGRRLESDRQDNGHGGCQEHDGDEQNLALVFHKIKFEIRISKSETNFNFLIFNI